MSEEYEEVEEAQLTPEELFEQHQAEIAERFEEKGFFRRLADMFKGFQMPRSSREYKLAKIELQRLKAPLIAILLPVIGVIALIVITAVTGQSQETIQIEVAQAVEEEVAPEDEPEPEIEPEVVPDEQVTDIVVDNPVPGPVSDMVNPTPVPQNTPLSVKPAAQDSVAIIKSPVTMRSMSGSRTPGSIGAMTRGGAGYGDANTEAAVLKALRWLKKTQSSNGSWEGFISNTGLAVLAFLAHGETPDSEEFGPTVEKAINFLITSFDDKGPMPKFARCDGHEYAFLIATYALAEAYGMTKNPNCKEVALKAVTRIVQNQSPTGGWDYNLKKTSERDDLSFEGWALQAVKAAKLAGLHPEGIEECIKKAIRCLQTRNFNGGGFNYCAGGKPTGLTATGCLCMQLLGYGDQKEVLSALDYMRNWKPVFESRVSPQAGGETPGSAPQYYCYYAAQCKYQAGMKAGALPVDVKTWQEWNSAMKALYPPSIVTLPEQIEGPDGKMHAMGYWENKDSMGNGKTMSTCLCALQLMVYYRYLPSTQAEGKTAKDPGKKKRKDKAVKVQVDL